MMVLRAANPWFRQQQEEEQRRPTTPTGLYVVMGEDMLLEEDLNHHHHSQNLLYNLNMLKEKLHQVETLLLNNNLAPLSPGQEAAGIAAGIQDIMVTASSMLFYCQQMSLNAAAMIHTTTTTTNNNNNNTHDSMQQDGSGFYIGKLEEGTPVGGLLVEDGHANKNNNNGVVVANGGISRSGGGGGGGGVSRSGFLSSSSSDYDIIEVGAGDLLAENSHYCHICGKGFKRDANLRMHMRAHGDEYKSNAALTKPPPPPPPRSSSSSASFEDYNSGQFLINLPRKYSCPEEGCRWNKKHAKFQPLKSMICVKNHYKRSHCPKMYVCNRCSRKKFSVLSDLRTHEKHCGDLKWRCSCGTTFSRKDKLLGHLALFVGHAPATHPIT